MTNVLKTAETDARSPETHSREPLLSVEDLSVAIESGERTIPAVDGVTFTVDRGETVCLVGESGSGKSVTCESITGIVPQPPAEIVSGRVRFDSIDVLESDESTRRSLRANRIAHIFQNPQSALDPVYPVGEQIAEPMAIHGNGTASSRRERAIDLMDRVGIPEASARIDDYPHEFSGGMRQRIAIAIALAADPDLLIADEPTTAVDVTVQARIIDLLERLIDDGTSLLLVTHDLRVVAALADRVVVLFGGTVVETGPVDRLFDRPAHPYTQALFESYTGQVATDGTSSRRSLPADGCRFREQCPHAIEDCAGGNQPPFYRVSDEGAHARGQTVSCVHYGPEGDPTEILETGREPTTITERHQ